MKKHRIQVKRKERQILCRQNHFHFNSGFILRVWGPETVIIALFNRTPFRLSVFKAQPERAQIHNSFECSAGCLPLSMCELDGHAFANSLFLPIKSDSLATQISGKLTEQKTDTECSQNNVCARHILLCGECGEMCAIGHLLGVQMKLNISVFVALRLVDDYYKRAFLCPSGNRSVHLIPYYILKNYMPLMVALITTIFCGRFVVCLCVCCVLCVCTMSQKLITTHLKKKTNQICMFCFCVWTTKKHISNLYIRLPSIHIN